MPSSTKPFRVLFAGTPDFAIPTLETLTSLDGIEIVACLTQPDRAVGRRAEPSPPPVKRWANGRNIPVLQPERLNDAAITSIRSLNLDLAVLVAYGMIVPSGLLTVPRRGWLNVHASLLPRWRGASPINHAILAGDAATGVTLIRLDKGLDTGPTLTKASCPIEPTDTVQTLTAKLGALGAALLGKNLLPYLRGEREPTPQPKRGVTLAPKLSKADGVVDWHRSSEEISRMVRALTPWPGARTVAGGKELKLIDVEPVPGASDRPPGSVRIGPDETIEVACGSGRLRLKRVQLESRRPMSAGEFLHGYRRLLTDPLGRSTAASGTAEPQASSPSPSRESRGSGRA